MEMQPIWPLPRPNHTDAQISELMERFPLWHYAYSFEGGLDFGIKRNVPNAESEEPRRPLQRFSHFMPLLNTAAGGLKGKRILDMACNSGFWSLQCALAGAQVIAFDAREELIQQAKTLKSITGAEIDFRVMDYFEASPTRLGEFDIVLNLGILYHLPKPLEALELAKSLSRSLVLVDTQLYPSKEPLMKVRWEEPLDIRNAAEAGIVIEPSALATEFMFRHLGFSRFEKLPNRTTDMPADYLDGRRASWLCWV